MHVNARHRCAAVVFVVALGLAAPRLMAASDELWVSYQPTPGAHNSTKIVLISGDEEYRSEEALPQLGKILARRHGFSTTVLFAIDPETRTIDPDVQTNIPGLEALRDADLMIMALRFRELPDEQMEHIVAFVESGKPLIALRTSTHAFFYRRNPEGRFANLSWNHEQTGGFGKMLLGETWVSHHGKHGSESTRGVINDEHRGHPVLRGVNDVWGPTDVYTVGDLLPGTRVLLWGQVLAGMEPSSPPVSGEKNDPMMPLAWVRERQVRDKKQRILTTTMGAATDLLSEHLRRLLINGVYWGLELEDQITSATDARTVGTYDPTEFGFESAIKGRKPSEHALP